MPKKVVKFEEVDPAQRAIHYRVDTADFVDPVSLPAGHNHDDRYFTKAQVLALLKKSVSSPQFRMFDSAVLVSYEDLTGSPMIAVRVNDNNDFAFYWQLPTSDVVDGTKVIADINGTKFVKP